MEQFWNFFWKLFGAALLIMFVAGGILGIINRSAETAYTFVQQTIAVALGLCGFIGFVVVPIEMYIEDRKQRGAR
ncbi:MAG: hypothetical protein LBP76_12455 [Treponema sp.]|jgi:quinol-cytochrome oxidoreductase complex cytochrome b subunit|nr:hypothetical protein [Treponema sp.]